MNIIDPKEFSRRFKFNVDAVREENREQVLHDLFGCSVAPGAAPTLLWHVKVYPPLQEIWHFAENLPIADQERAFEIMRLCIQLYVEMERTKEAAK